MDDAELHRLYLRHELASTGLVMGDWRLIASEVAAIERERLLALAKKRADYEASAAAKHAGRWQTAYEHHLTRHAAMRDLIEVLKGPNHQITGAQRPVD